MTAFQIQVAADATLDGTTAFSWPTTLPTPSNNVYVLSAGANINVGVVDLDAMPNNLDQPKGWWLKALHVEAPRGATGVGALRIRCTGPSQNTPFEVMPDLLAATGTTTPIIMGLRTLFPEALLPRGATLTFLAGTDNTFATPVDGPYNLYFEVVPICDDTMFVAVTNVVNAAKNKALARGFRYGAFQGAAATAQERFRVTRRCVLTRASFTSATLPAAGESMSITIDRVANGGSDVGTNLVTQAINNATYTTTNSALSLPLSNTTGTIWFNPGDQIRVTRTYVAGGGPTPMINTNVMLELLPLPSRIVQSEGIAL